MDAAEAARGEPLVVALVPGGGSGEHDKVTELAARHAVCVILRVVGRAEVVAHLVSHGHVRYGGGHVLPVVHQGNDARVETLVTPSVVLKIEEKIISVKSLSDFSSLKGKREFTNTHFI